MIEAWQADAWLYAALIGDADGIDGNGDAYQGLATLIGARVYPDLAPACESTSNGAPQPWIAYSLMSDADSNSLGLERGSARMVYMVKAVCAGGSWSPLAPVMNRVDAVMQGARAAQGGVKLTVSRQGVKRWSEFDNGMRYNNAAGLYAIVAQQE